MVEANIAATAGGGMFISSCQPKVLNNTIIGNHAGSQGGGISLGNTSIAIRNCIVWGNTVGASGTASSIELHTASTDPDVIHCDMDAPLSGPGSGASYTGQLIANLSLDPMFSGLPGDYHLQPCSPMVNAGTPDTVGLGLPDLEFYSEQRVFDTVDIGATEYQGPRPVVPVIVPVQLEFCANDPGYVLSFGQTPGGHYKGTGVSGNKFYPIFAGPGQHWIKFGFGDSLSCPPYDSVLFTVNPQPAVTHPAIEVCADAVSLSLSGGTPATGTYSGNFVSGGSFNVQTAGVGTHIIQYTYTDLTTTCSRTINVQVTVHPLPVIVFPDPSSVCQG
ncbi:MAG: hypothetical protein IH599_03730, partial [Bacteroidales bacterium]|nr:hypothetical protein [Bacteroidales bacterium]